MADFKQVDEARKTLGLNEIASIDDIKEAYRKCVLQYHPDKCKEKDKKKCNKMFKKIVSANETLMSYCMAYKFSFKENDIVNNLPDKEINDYMNRFYRDDWFGNVK